MSKHQVTPKALGAQLFTSLIFDILNFYSLSKSHNGIFLLSNFSIDIGTLIATNQVFSNQTLKTILSPHTSILKEKKILAFEKLDITLLSQILAH